MPDLFRAAVLDIMTGRDEPPSRLGDAPAVPASHGWLRRPDYDRDGARGWELPDGAIRLVAVRAPPQAANRPARPDQAAS